MREKREVLWKWNLTFEGVLGNPLRLKKNVRGSWSG